jgi:hypothetical protein
MEWSGRSLVALVASWIAVAAFAAPQSAQEMQQGLESEARQIAADFSGFSPQAGERFFRSTHVNDWSCASCHTQDPRSPGRHARTGKDIAPLAPAANPERFTRLDKVEKWFKRNCDDVLGRPCTLQEKGNVLAYLLSLK